MPKSGQDSKKTISVDPPVLRMAGGSLADVQRNLGHSTPVLTSETYGHIADDHRVREADTRLLLGLASPKPARVQREPNEGNEQEPAANSRR